MPEEFSGDVIGGWCEQEETTKIIAQGLNLGGLI